MSIQDQLRSHEGVRRYPYEDTAGKLTIGVGRNLDDRGISDDEIDYLLRNDLRLCAAELDVIFLQWRDLSENRQNVLIDMVFNLGRTRFAKFVNFWQALSEGDYAKAADEMLDSRWAVQVGQRAITLAGMMRNDEPFR